MSPEFIASDVPSDLQFLVSGMGNLQILDIDRFKIELLSPDLFPEDTLIGCNNLLFGNGDAESTVLPNELSTWPWETGAHAPIESEVRNDGSMNRFFSSSGHGTNERWFI